MDVGARWGPDERLGVLGGDLVWHGFEPDPEEAARLAASLADRPGHHVAATALAATEGPVTIHLAAHPACSSLLPADPGALDRHPDLCVAAPAGTTTVEATTLDHWATRTGVTWIDLLKLDVQGGELDVLTGASDVLTRTSVVESEVEFNPVYLDQPLFGDIDRHLRDRGFTLWRLGGLVHYGLRWADDGFDLPDRQFFGSQPVAFTGRGGQLSWATGWWVHADLVAPPESSADPDRRVRAGRVLAALGFHDAAAVAGSQPAFE